MIALRRYFILLVVLGFGASASQAQIIRWAGSVDICRPNALHAPDNKFTAGLPITVSDFGFGMRYTGLARLLGISPRDLARAEVIAFEGNGGHGAGPENGWESSIWTFSDGVNTYVARFNEVTGRRSDPSVIATGSIGGSNFLQGETLYSRFFGVCNEPTNKVVSYILFDLSSTRPPIDVTSPRFSIKLENGFTSDGSFGEGSPDLDAVGIFSACR